MRLCSRNRPRIERTRIVLGQPFDPGPQHADRARADVDLRARRAGGVQLVDDRRVDEVVELEPDPGRLAVLRGGRDRADLLDEPLAHLERRHEELAEPLGAAEAGDVVEDVGDVGGDLLVGREDPDVLVEPRRRGVVVAGADVDVAAQPARLATDDERHLRVDLHVREPVHDVHARLLELARPLDVAPLVEAGLQLDEADRLLPLLGAVDQRRDERAVVGRAVDRRLHRDHVGVRRGGGGECLEARPERLVGLMDEHVATADLVEEARRVLHAGEARLRHRRPRLVLEVGPVEPHELHQVGEVEEALDLVHLVVAWRRARRGGDRASPSEADADDLDADHVAEAAAPELRLDRLEEIVGVVGHLEVGVARDAEERLLGDLHPGEERREEVRDHRLERHEALAGARRTGRGPRAP